jgi:hypothetical protein
MSIIVLTGTGLGEARAVTGRIDSVTGVEDREF